MDAVTAPTGSSSAQQQQGQQQQSQSGGASNGPQVRSRVTVVCAECKRLKLKCDRRVPCGSCQKRDTVPRCIYSPAAAEKVDLHSLNNRLTVVESQLAQMGSGSRPYNHHGGPHIPPNDRAILAVGQFGSSLTISLEDVTAIWLSQLDLNKDLFPTQTQINHPLTSSFSPYSCSAQITLDHTAVSSPSGNPSELPAALLVPPPSIYYSTSPTSQEAPSVTPRLIALLPSSPFKRRKLCNNVEEILKINPCFHWKHFRERLDGIFRWAAETEVIERATLESGRRTGSASKADVARAIMFGEPASTSKKTTLPRPTVSFYAAVVGALALGAQANGDQNGNVINDEDNDMAAGNHNCDGRSSSRKTPSVASSGHSKKAKTSSTAISTPSNTGSKSTTTSGSPVALFALAEQALDIFEKSNTYDLDYLIALILRALYMSHDGKPVVDHRLYPLVGKMANIARMMGLGMDPDEFPGKYSLFEAETRRRLWWEVFCYDLYVSDSMGHAPFIIDNSFTTKIPADVDESLFSPSSTSIPAPNNDDHAAKYFGLKIRLAQLVKSVKKRTFKDPLGDSNSELLSLEDASLFEAEVTSFLFDLPPAFQLDIDHCLSTLNASVNSSSSTESFVASSSSVYLIAQQCELMITGQRLILKLYLPFLRPHPSSTGKANTQATLSTINAAHNIVNASRVLHALYKQPSGFKRPGPAIFDFYSFGQALFDAAVICAHSAIQQPTAIWAKTALEDVAGALMVMKDPMVATGRGPMNGGVEGSVSEAVQVIEILKKKADSVKGGGSGALESNTGSKRKHDEIESETNQLLAGFQLPYVGAAVASVSPVRPDSSSLPPPTSPPESGGGTPPHGTRPRLGTPNSATPTINGSEGRGTKCTPVQENEKSKSKEKGKKPPYPSVGIRVRPGREGPPAIRQRERAPSTTSTSSFPDSDTRMQPPPLTTISRPPSLPPTSAPTNMFPFAMHQNQEAASIYHSSLSASQMSPPMQPEPVHSPTTDYPPPFNDADVNVNDPRARKFGVHDSQGYATTTSPQLIFDQNQSNPYASTTSPVSFHPGSNGQSFDEGTGLSSPQYDPALPPHHSSPQSYRPPLPTAPANYYAPGPYQPSYDNSSQGPLGLNLAMDTSSGPSSSVTTSSGDMMYDVKPLNAEGSLQQSFRHSGQGQVWQQDDSNNANGMGYWQSDFKQYYSS